MNAARQQQTNQRAQTLLAAIQSGIPLVRRPYLAIAKHIGASEAEVIRRLRDLLAAKIIKRLGVIVRHRQLGYTANAMVVWDVPDNCVDAIGEQMGQYDFVTLCYRRPRRPPHWPYNLFCMIHGRDRFEVQQQVAHLRKELNLPASAGEILFSRRCFKQRGACYTGQFDEPGGRV